MSHCVPARLEHPTTSFEEPYSKQHKYLEKRHFGISVVLQNRRLPPDKALKL
jgi:hypothetical protein